VKQGAADGIDAVGLLQDPLRRRLYEFVSGQDHDVSRNEAAEAAGVQRTLAAFHLDRLVESGLLDAVFRRVSGKSGPGAGRPAKLYRRSAAEFEVSVPRRDYTLLASLLAETAEGMRLNPEVEEVARRRGQSDAAEGTAVAQLLASRGYEPTADDRGVLRLRNCPFHRLAEQFPPLVCGANFALLDGLVEGTGYTARMDARPGWCCVAIHPPGASINNQT
jgi:predicted ArsR family transcriptional regulator